MRIPQQRCVLKAERAQLLDRVRSQIDPTPSMRVGAASKIWMRCAAFAHDRKRQRQSTDAPADDDEIHSLVEAKHRA